jgi:putative ABC transport system permease protein
MTGLLQDFRYAIRQLRKSLGFTAVAVITLALGIGANTAVFSVIDAVMLRPLPYYQPERLIEANSVNSHDPAPRSLCYPDFFDWRAQNHTLEHLVSYHDQTFTLTGLERPVQVDAQIVSWDLLPALGVHPELGRGFTWDEEKVGTRVVLISHALWASQFGADPAIIGRGIHLSGGLYTVVGVMSSNFRFPVTAPRNGVWTTLAADDDPADPHPVTTNRGSHFLNVFGRLKSGATAAQADLDLRGIAANLSKQYPNTNTRNDSARVRTEISALVGDARGTLLVVLGAVALVLLVACGNIANLLLARMRERQREIAVRSALGAGRTRIVRQLLAESLALSALGGLAGCGLAFVCTPAILSLIGDSVPRAADAGVDLRVLLFAILASFAAGLIFGIVPATTASRTNLVSTLKEGGRSDVRGRDWLRSSLIVGQVALGLVLTAAAGLLITSFVNLMHTGEGFNPDHLTTLRFETPDARYETGDARPQFYRNYFEKLRALPGVQSAAGVMVLPMTNDGIVIAFDDPEHPRPEGQFVSADLTPVTPEYFSTMQVPVLKGREFSERDDMKSPQVMVVNQSFAQKFFPGEEVLGKKLKPGANNGTPGGAPWREIVGVVGNIRMGGTQREMEPAMYLPAAQLPAWCCLYSVMRASLDPASLEVSVQQIVSSMDKDIPVTQVRTMKELMYSQLAQPRFATILLSTFAGLALVLTVVGLYGVMTYSVTRRTREIGVRMALGAERGTVLTMVLRDAATLLGAGIVVGIAAALMSASVLQDMLYGTGSRNPVVLALVCVVVALAGVVAALIPARRAAKVDPMVALRYE